MSCAYSFRRSTSIWSESLLRQHFGEADDGIERSAQLVTHGGEEPALGGVRAFRFRARFFERMFLHLAIGGVAHDRHHLALASGVAFVRAPSTGRQRISIQMNCATGRPLVSVRSRRTRNSTERLSPSDAASASAVR